MEWANPGIGWFGVSWPVAQETTAGKYILFFYKELTNQKLSAVLEDIRRIVP